MLRSDAKLTLLLSVGFACASLSAQTTDNTAQPAPNSRSNAIRQMIQAQAARRAAQAQQANQANQAGTVPTSAGQPAQPVPAQPSPNTAIPPQPQRPAAQSQTPAAPAPAATTPVDTPAQASEANQAPASVKSVREVKEKNEFVIQIVTSRPVPPALKTDTVPPRLVIDLPNANVGVKEKDRDFIPKGNQFTGLRIDQYQVSPPVTRIVVDLAQPKPYTWDAAGNRLTIRLKPPDEPKPATPPPVEPPTVSTFSSAPKPAVVPVSSRGAGSPVLAGSRIGNGSTLTASTETAVLHIARGGELHVCPGSSVSVTASKNGQELMFGMSTGTLETHYNLASSADAILTPDFRILLSGPGEFDYAISANSHGDTCVRALLGNTAPITVAELMGDRTYQVRPTEQVIFHEGRIDRMSNDVPFDCGCGSPPPAVLRASADAPPPTQVAEANLPPNLQMPPSNAPAAHAVLDPMLPPMPSSSRPAVAARTGSQASLTSRTAETTPPPMAKPSDIHVQIEAPLVFRGSDRAKTTTTASNAPPKPANSQPRSDPAAPIPTSAPPPKPVLKVETQQQHRGFFGKVKGFFASIFH